MSALGRLLQFAAMLLLPAAMVVQLFGGLSVGQLLVALVFGVAAFYLGRMLEGYGVDETPKKSGPKKRASKK